MKIKFYALLLLTLITGKIFSGYTFSFTNDTGENIHVRAVQMGSGSGPAPICKSKTLYEKDLAPGQGDRFDTDRNKWASTTCCLYSFKVNDQDITINNKCGDNTFSIRKDSTGSYFSKY